jgi:hypothetical protein
MQMKRIAIGIDELLAKICEGMQHPADGECKQCLPVQLSPIHPVAGGINWQVQSHGRPCSPPCEAKLMDVCTALGDRYDVDWGAARAER